MVNEVTRLLMVNKVFCFHNFYNLLALEDQAGVHYIWSQLQFFIKTIIYYFQDNKMSRMLQTSLNDLIQYTCLQWNDLISFQEKSRLLPLYKLLRSFFPDKMYQNSHQ